MARWLWRSAVFAWLVAGAAAPAMAADFVVTKTTDTHDGICNADCSLREAIVAANAQPGNDRIVLGNGLTYTLTIGPADLSGALSSQSGDLDIADGLIVDGNGSTIDAAGLDRVLDIQGNFSVTIRQLTVRGGVASGFLSMGGGIYIRNAAVTLINVAVTENSTAPESGARDNGGGIAVVGSFDAASGTTTRASLALTSSRVANNTGASGGAIICVLCTMSSANTEISGNVSTLGDGAGAMVAGNASSVMLAGSTLQFNTGAARGGALAVPYGTGSVTLTHNRILTNAATLASGVFSGVAAVTATNNWWGCNFGPGAAGLGCAMTADSVAGPVTASPHLILQAVASPTALTAPGTSAFTADLTVNSAASDTSAGGTIQNNIPVEFASTFGTLAMTSGATSGGKALTTFTAGSTAATATLTATVDNQSVAALVTISPPAMPRRVRGDLDGDSLAELIVWRPSDGTWYWLTSSTGYAYTNARSKQWGSQSAGDVPFLGDIDGDGSSDLIIWRASTGTWFWLTSSTNYNYASARSQQWGNKGLGDIPMLADMDGDGRSDLVIWRASTGTWYWLSSSTNYNPASAVGYQWGNQGLGDVPILGDFDGDTIADLGIWRASTGTWYWLTSTSGYSYANAGSKQWGSLAEADKPMLADIDGDARVDLMVWRPSLGAWFILTSTTNYDYASSLGIQWGAGTDTPLLGDFDGDGRAELIIWRASTGQWFWLSSLSGYSYSAAGMKQWGSQAAGDIPMIR
jgi:CSLREA domain-containing protein